MKAIAAMRQNNIEGSVKLCSVALTFIKYHLTSFFCNTECITQHNSSGSGQEKQYFKALLSFLDFIWEA